MHTFFKRFLVLVISSCLVLSGLAGCGKAGTSASSDSAKSQELPRVILVIPGSLGDKSFFDSANEGMKLIHDELGCDTKVVQMGTNPAPWKSTLHAVSDLDWDIIITVSYAIQEILQEVALEHPDKHYIIADGSVDFDSGLYNNIHSISFSQNEASYLAGALAAMVASDSSLPYSKGNGVTGVIAAMDTPNINDFVVGYIQGATETVPGAKVLTSYVGSFSDTAKAKDLARAQHDSGAQVCFNVCGVAGLGMIEAAAENSFYAIGVDSDQALSLEAAKPEQARMIVTSVLKNVGRALFLTVQDYIEGGEIPYGTASTMGISDGAVGIADNSYYQAIATDEMKAKLDEIENKIISGEINVKSAFKMTNAEVSAMRAAARP